jgi:hypothetical protein
MHDGDQRTEAEKNTMERISEDARRQSQKDSYRTFLDFLQKELQEILPGKTVKYKEVFSAADYFSGGFPGWRPLEVTEHETHFLNMCSFEEYGLKYTLGIFPRHTSGPILDIGPKGPKTFRCVIYNEKALSITKESVARFAWVLRIKNLTIEKMYGKGNLSLATQEGGLSLAPQQIGDLTIVEK